MSKKRILVPIDGTERSMHSLSFVKNTYSNKDVELLIMNVKELVFINGMVVSNELENAKLIGERILNEAVKKIEGYDLKTYFTFGYPADEIVRKAKEENIDLIVMTKSTKKGLTRMIGSVTVSVVKHAKCTVVIVPE